MIALARQTHDKCQETDGNPMTAHRAASPVQTEVMSVGHEWLLSTGEPSGMRYASPLRPPVPMLDELAATQPSATCGLHPTPDSVSTRETLSDPDLQLGFATFDSMTRRGVLATIFHDRVLTVAQRADLDYRVLLGRAMAHEIGHLLLPASGHSMTGLMRGVWTDAELTLNRREDWTFAPAERKRLQAASIARPSR